MYTPHHGHWPAVLMSSTALQRPSNTFCTLAMGIFSISLKSISEFKHWRWVIRSDWQSVFQLILKGRSGVEVRALCSLTKCFIKPGKTFLYGLALYTEALSCSWFPLKLMFSALILKSSIWTKVQGDMSVHMILSKDYIFKGSTFNKNGTLDVALLGCKHTKVIVIINFY